MSTLYRLLVNPFYAGYFHWDGKLYQGKHESMISLEDHRHLQQLVGRKGIQRPSKNDFPYTGLMRCGSCGLGITAEKHTNRFGSRYVYYHCTKRNIGERCRQPYIEAKELEAQLVDFLRRISIPRDFEEWVIREGLAEEEKTQVSREAARESLERTRTELQQQLSILTDLRVRDYIREEEFVNRRKKLELDLEANTRRLNTLDDTESWFEPATSLISFSKCAIPWLLAGDAETKRLIVRTAGSNPVLVEKRLSIQAAKPFAAIAKNGEILNWRARLKEVRTLIEEKDPETADVLQRIKQLEIEKGLVLPPLHLNQRPPSDLEAAGGITGKD